MIPTVYSKSNVGVPLEVLKITSTVEPSLQTSPPPVTSISGRGFTVIVAASVKLSLHPFESSIAVYVYIEVVVGLTTILSEIESKSNGVPTIPFIL